MAIRFLIAATLSACAALVLSRLTGNEALGAATKILASTGFLAVAWHAGLLTFRTGRIVFAGLICSAAGDIFLLGGSESAFLAGLVSFLLAHVLYIAAFLDHGVNVRRVLQAVVPLTSLSLMTMYWLNPYLPPAMSLPVFLYTAVISAMVVCAAGAFGRGAPPIVLLGALLFYFSDLSVAAGQFVQPDFPNYVWGLPFYYGGQLLIALGIARTTQTPAPAA